MNFVLPEEFISDDMQRFMGGTMCYVVGHIIYLCDNGHYAHPNGWNSSFTFKYYRDYKDFAYWDCNDYSRAIKNVGIFYIGFVN